MYFYLYYVLDLYDSLMYDVLMDNKIRSDKLERGWFYGVKGEPFYRTKLLVRQALAEACIHIMACEELVIEW